MTRVSGASFLAWVAIDTVHGYLATGGVGTPLWVGLGLSTAILLAHEALGARLRAGHGEIVAPVVFTLELGLMAFVVWFSAAMGSTWPDPHAIVLGIVYLSSLAVGALVGMGLLFGLVFGRRG